MSEWETTKLSLRLLGGSLEIALSFILAPEDSYRSCFYEGYRYFKRCFLFETGAGQASAVGLNFDVNTFSFITSKVDSVPSGRDWLPPWRLWIALKSIASGSI